MKAEVSSRIKMKDLCEITSSKRIYAADYQEDGVPFYRGKEIVEKYNGATVLSTNLFISQNRYDEIKSRFGLPQLGDILLTSVGTLGIPFLVKSDEDFYFKDGNLTWFKDFQGIDSSYLYYWLLSPIGKGQLQKCMIGTSQSAYTIVRMKEMDIDPPDTSTQTHIADILSAYDDFIENNRQRIALLEQAVRLLYREWFVYLRFPGHEHVKIVDGVPEGWEMMLTPEAIDINPSTRLSDDSHHWFVEMASLQPNSMVIENAIKRDGRSGSKFQNGDTLLARITPCLENGKTGFVNFMSNGEVGRGSTEFIVLRSKRVTPEYVYCLARTYEFRENAIKSMIGSSGRQRVQESCFEKFSVWIPSPLVLELFSDNVIPIFQQIRLLHSQNQNTSKARDILLPRLMNGEIAV